MVATIVKSALFGLTLGATLAFAASSLIVEHRPASNGSAALMPTTAIVPPPTRASAP